MLPLLEVQPHLETPVEVIHVVYCAVPAVALLGSLVVWSGVPVMVVGVVIALLCIWCVQLWRRWMFYLGLTRHG